MLCVELTYLNTKKAIDKKGTKNYQWWKTKAFPLILRKGKDNYSHDFYSI